MTSKRSVKSMVLNPECIAQITAESFSGDVDGGSVTWKTLLSAPKTDTDTFTTGIAKCEPQGGHLKCHRHAQAEIYYITCGRGLVSIDGQDYPVQQGSVVFIPGDSEHGIRNTGSEDLVWLYVFAANRFEEVVYRFSEDKSRARAKL